MNETLLLSAAAALLLALIVSLVSRWRRQRLPLSNEELLVQTFAHIQAHQPQLAIERLRHLYEQSQHDLGYGLALGSLLRSVGKNEIALRTHLSLASRFDLPPHALILIQAELAADYLASGDPENARTTLEKVLAQRVPDEALTQTGEAIYTRLGDYSEAAKLIAAYGKSEGLDVSGRIAALYHRQAEAALDAQDPSQAKRALRKARAAQKLNLHTMLLQARLLRETGKPRRARNYLSKQLTHFRDKTWMAMEEYRLAAMTDGEDQRFQTFAEEYLGEQDHDRDWQTRAVLARFLAEVGQQEYAAESLLTCLAEAPHALLLHQAFWSVLSQYGDPRLLKRYRAILQKYPSQGLPFRCSGCSAVSERCLWVCPSCNRSDSFVTNTL